MRTHWLTRQTVAWVSYDVASSVYFGLAPAVLLPLYFQELMADFANPTAAWGGLASIAILASSFGALAAAALSTRVPRFKLLMLFSVSLLVAMGALGSNPWSSLLLAALAYVAAQTFYFAATTVYESFLPDLLPGTLRQKLSGFGWATGYLGGVAGIIVLLVLTAGRQEGTDVLEMCFGVLAIISAPLFAAVFVLMHRAGFAQLGEGGPGAQFSGLVEVVARWRSHRAIYRLLLGNMLVQAAVSVVITFTAPILASRFGQSLQDLLWLLMLVHVLSVPSTFGWSMLMSGRARVLPMAALLLAWAMVLLLLAFGSAPWIPLAIVTVIGCCLGATASTLRGLLAEALPAGSSAAFFGLATVVGRVSAALGPALFALIYPFAGERAAMLSILVVLATGASLVLLHMQTERLPAGAGAS